MQIQLKAAGEAVEATMLDTQAAGAFIELLPLVLKLSDFNSTEKVGDLPVRLDTTGSPAGFTPKRGDIAYYAPWGNLAIFYRDFGYSRGLVKLGTITSGMDALDDIDDLEATFQPS